MPASHRVRALTIAGVLVLAAAMVTTAAYSSTAIEGGPLMAGARNTETSVTTIARQGVGPALRLESAHVKAPPLTVNATGRVRNLNADMLDGRNASQLVSRAIAFRAGKTGDSIDTGALWSFEIKPGLYTVSLRAIMNLAPSDPNATAASVICGVLDLDTFNAPNTRVYLADSAVQLPDGLPAAMSGATTIRIRTGESPGGICISPNSSLQLFKPVTFSFANLDRRSVSDAEPVDINQRQLRSFTPR